jgi:hypothetical protein
MENVLIALLLVQLLGTTIFGKFQVEAPKFEMLRKWIVIDGLIIGSYYLIGQWAILFLLILFFIGIALHFYICKKHGFDPINATPRKKYYAFKNWEWQE